MGVVENTRQWGAESTAIPEMYFPQTFRANHSGYLVVRAAAGALPLIPLVREQLGSLDRNLPLANIRTMRDVLQAANSDRRLSTQLMNNHREHHPHTHDCGDLRIPLVSYRSEAKGNRYPYRFGRFTPTHPLLCLVAGRTMAVFWTGLWSFGLLCFHLCLAFPDSTASTPGIRPVLSWESP